MSRIPIYRYQQIKVLPPPRKGIEIEHWQRFFKWHWRVA